MYLKGLGIACHPPVLIPEIGEGRENEAEKTIRGLRDLALKVAEIKPEVIVCITPHGNVFRDGVAAISLTVLAALTLPTTVKRRAASAST